MGESTSITIKGQITIPKAIRDELGLKTGDRLVFEREGGKIVIKPTKTLLDFRGHVKTRKYIPMGEARKIAKGLRGKRFKVGPHK